MDNTKKIRRMAKLSMLCALSVILVYFVHFPLFPAVAFLEYDPADISVLIGTFAFGPWAGIALTIAVSLVQGLTVSAQSGWYGIIMHVISTGVLALCSGLIYKRFHHRKGAVLALSAGTLAMTFVMFFANLVITPLFMSVDRAVVLQLMPFILLFNLCKAGINSVLTFVLYKRVADFIRK